MCEKCAHQSLLYSFLVRGQCVLVRSADITHFDWIGFLTRFGVKSYKVVVATFRRPLAGISVSGLQFRCFGHRISKFPAPEHWDFNISSSGASGCQDFQLRG